MTIIINKFFLSKLTTMVNPLQIWCNWTLILSWKLLSPIHYSISAQLHHIYMMMFKILTQ